MTLYNHYGKYIDKNTPITGVVQNNNVPAIYNEICSGNEIDLDFEMFILDRKSQGLSEEQINYELEHFELCDVCTYLIGDWVKGEDGLYEPNPLGEYSAIVRESVTQVVYSKYTKRCNLCSPCYPGQADLDSPNEDGFLAYDLPNEIYGRFCNE